MVIFQLVILTQLMSLIFMWTPHTPTYTHPSKNAYINLHLHAHIHLHVPTETLRDLERSYRRQ